MINDTNGQTPTPKFTHKKLPPIAQNGDYNALPGKSFENSKNLSFISDNDKVKENGSTANGE